MSKIVGPLIFPLFSSFLLVFRMLVSVKENFDKKTLDRYTGKISNLLLETTLDAEDPITPVTRKREHRLKKQTKIYIIIK